MSRTAKTYYKKEAGTLELSTSTLQWTREGEGAPSLRVSLADANGLFCSKDGVAQVKLKLALKNDEQGHTFTFVSNNASGERDKFKRDLSAVIAKNRPKDDGQANATSPSRAKTAPSHQRSGNNTPGLPSRPSREGTRQDGLLPLHRLPGWLPRIIASARRC